MKTNVILGIGNVLLSDDGAGIHTARLLEQWLDGRADVEVIDGGTLSFTLAPVIASARRLIILDATQLNQPPGAVRCFVGDEVDELLGRARLTVHEIGLRDLMEICRITGELPRERALVGIQPASLGWGTEPTPAVAASLESAAILALGLLEKRPLWKL